MTPVLYSAHFALMGGTAAIRFVDLRGQDAAEKIAAAAATEARRVEAKFSRFKTDSLLARINLTGSEGSVAIDAETAALIRRALELSALTGGRFDPTVGVLNRAWDFQAGRVPSGADLKELLPLVDASAIELREGFVRLATPGMELDLGGVGKEYAVDRVAELLRKAGVQSALVNFSGDVRTVGLRGDGRPWAVGVQDPRNRHHCRFAIRVLGSAGVATSGDYERYFMKGGLRYHHLLDARTGMPARGLASATVIAATASAAGRLATAAFLLGPVDGLALLERTPNAEGALITEAGRIIATTGMARISDLPQRGDGDALAAS